MCFSFWFVGVLWFRFRNLFRLLGLLFLGAGGGPVGVLPVKELEGTWFPAPGAPVCRAKCSCERVGRELALVALKCLSEPL